MKIKDGQTDVYIADDNPVAKKIKQGYEYRIENGKVIIGEKTGFDIDAFKNKLEQKTATLEEMQEYLLYTINK